MHNIVIAGAGRTKRAAAVRSLEELIARTTDPIITIPIHAPKDDDVPELLAWAYGTAKRFNVKFNVVMLEEDYDLAIERGGDPGSDYELVNRLIKDANEVAVVNEEAQVFSIAVQEADEVVVAYADEDRASARVLRLAQRRSLPVTDLTGLVSSAGETDDEDDEDILPGSPSVERLDATHPMDDEEYGAEEGAGALWVPEEPQDRLSAAIEGLVEALVATVLERVTVALKAAQ